MTKNSSQDARIFTVETRFQRLARRAGGVPRDAAIEQAQTRIEEIKAGFDDWLDQELRDLAGLVRRAQAGNAEPDWIEVANFQSRQLRDVGTTMDFELLTFIANTLCEIFDAISEGAEYNFESIMCHVDALMLARNKPYRSFKPEQLPELTNGLLRVAECVSASPKDGKK